jgi:hypothetical protein
MVAAMVILLASAAGAQHALSGAWEGETRNGSTIVLTLQVEGSTLTGTLSRNGEQVPIVDGTVAKQQFAFKATLNGQAESVSGEIAAEGIKVWLDRQGRDGAITLRRPAKK